MSHLTKLSEKDRRKRFLRIAKQVSTCPRCLELVKNRTQSVFGSGDLNAEIMLVGEAPGSEEDKQGEPFVGAAGRKLTKLLEEVGIQRKEIFITNTIKCRPPGNRKPLASEISNCHDYLEQQVDLIRPRVLCALGGVAAQSMLGTSQSIGRLREKVHEYRGVSLICTYHPAYLFRNEAAVEMIRDDLEFLLEELDRRRK